MDSNNTARQRYTLPAIAFHWLLALALFGMFGMGLFMADLPLSPLKLKLYNWHKWAGMTFLLLSALRLLWRLTHQPPPLPAQIAQDMPRWQHLAHNGIHTALYALFFLVPLIGWAYSSASGFPIVLFGVLPLPDFVPSDKALAELIKPWHEISAFAMMGLVLIHTLAAFKHQWINKNGLIQRILPVQSTPDTP